MSRTKHHRTQKHVHCGDDYWSPRGGQNGNMYNSYTKLRTHRIERQENKVRVGVVDNEFVYDTKEVSDVV